MAVGCCRFLSPRPTYKPLNHARLSAPDGSCRLAPFPCHAEGRGFESLHPLLLSQTDLQIWDFDSCECREPRAATFCLHLEPQARLVGWPANGRSYRITLRNKPA